jgi:ribosomal protein L7/L12
VDYGWLSLGILVVILIVMQSSSGASRKIQRLESKVDQVERKLGQVERKLDAVIGHLGVELTEPALQPLPLPEPGLDKVHEFLRQGQKIQAIKAYRESTGAGLKEAKEAVERITGER